MNPSEVVVFGLAAYLVLVALLLGSFINMAADRLPRHESLVHPRSHCRSKESSRPSQSRNSW